IKAECGATRYPAMCVQCLSNYTPPVQQSQRQLAQAALSVSLTRAKSATSFVSKLARIRGIKPMEYQAVKDCIQNMGDTVDQLSRSMKELGAMGRVAGQDFDWRVSNVQTWVSAALTNENTCMDGFRGSAMDGNVKVAIRRRVLDCAQVTSNALALVNRFASRHKVGDSLD
ncbi:21 kDa protein, partial [Sesamum indicum]|uniref:21 kDa protein n=1 Tax=Sesamum indicum TaxID=4182 RepID=A0A6I9TAK0_SESIN